MCPSHDWSPKPRDYVLDPTYGKLDWDKFALHKLVPKLPVVAHGLQLQWSARNIAKMSPGLRLDVPCQEVDPQPRSNAPIVLAIENENLDVIAEAHQEAFDILGV